MQITVVGAGIIGLSIAWRLHRDGHRITVVDPAPASGATHAAGGMLTPVGEAWHGEDDLTALLLASARRYASFVEDVSGHLSAGTPTGYSESGTLICGADAADRGDLTALHEAGLTMTEHAPDFVVLGETRQYSFEAITTAVRLVRDGARFIATNPCSDPT